MNEQVFMVTGGKKTQQIEGTIDVAPPVGGATEAKQDAIIAELQLKANVDETQPVSASNLDIRDLVFATDKVDVSGSTVQDIPAVSGGLSKFHLVGAATTNATNVKASAGQVYAITAFNITAVPIFLKFHNTAGTPTAGTGVTDTYLIPANTSGTGVVVNIDKGIAFATGIGVTLVTGIADADATAIAASSVVLNIYYK